MTGWYSMPSEFVSSKLAKQSKPSTPNLLALEPAISWIDVAGMRNHLAHRYFDTAHAIVRATLSEDLPSLVAATERLLDHFTVDPRS